MELDASACYRAIVAHDARFDGVFFVGVKTTGVYCRPVCKAGPPRADRCVFFKRAAEAERDGFRACFRCRPERAPGGGVDDSVSRTVAAAVARIQEGALNEGDVDSLAGELGVTARHLRRCTHAELGVSPLDLALSRKLAMARELLASTRIPVTDVAFASGFQSVRRFNDAFRSRHGRSPSELRHDKHASVLGDAVSLELDYRPPYGWESTLRFLAARSVDGVEAVVEGRYYRTALIGERTGWVSVRKGARDSLILEISPSLVRDVMTVAQRIRRLFDLDARPAAIDEHLRTDRRLAPLVHARPGLRVPGSFEPFDTALMAILGQQVTLRAGITLASRLVAAFGTKVTTPFPFLNAAWPTPERALSLDPRRVARLGMPERRAATLVALARAVARREVRLDGAGGADALLASLLEIPGIGPWTAQYILMRGAAWPDAFPAGDVAIARALAMPSAKACLPLADAWRPWRSYATLHLWTSLTGETS
jgi:AraC family transcriptional regulator, regulatory protein of adaptative response / DNA-3-methyladenine glycosylase II